MSHFVQAFDGNGGFHSPRIKDRCVGPLDPCRLHARRDGADDVKRIAGNQPRVILVTCFAHEIVVDIRVRLKGLQRVTTDDILKALT